jgi:hypothetical protein
MEIKMAQESSFIDKSASIKVHPNATFIHVWLGLRQINVCMFASGYKSANINNCNTHSTVKIDWAKAFGVCSRLINSGIQTKVAFDSEVL